MSHLRIFVSFSLTKIMTSGTTFINRRRSIRDISSMTLPFGKAIRVKSGRPERGLPSVVAM